MRPDLSGRRGGKALRARAARRIHDYVTATFGSTRAAEEALHVDHGTIWRAMQGHNARGPGNALVTALADHSGKPTDYWLGRAE